MKKKLKMLLVAAVAVAGISGAATTAQARIFPGTQEGPCIDGYIDVFHFGWFGSISYLESKTC